jgi:MFS family permease
MIEWFKFVFSNKRLLNFGFLFNFFSSFGQTFFISLFVPFWISSLSITNAAFGSIYAIVTILSAFLISVVGKYIDKWPLNKFALIVFSGLIISVVILSQAYNIVILGLGLFLVRWFGQGLMTHTSTTGIAKHFDENRGKALGFTALGHPVGQFLLPLFVVPLINFTSWRTSLLIMSIIAVALIIPSLKAIVPVTKFVSSDIKKREINELKSHYFKSFSFWVIAANSFLIPFICTAIFLYQYTIGQMKGWDISWVAFSFAFYAIFNGIFLLISGNLVDKYSGLKLFPLYLIPTLIALISIALIDNKWVFPIFYALLGISSGLGVTIKTSVQVEVYGVNNLGKIRSYFSTILVLSTAIGPPVFGFLIDKNWPMRLIMFTIALITFVVFFLSFYLQRKKRNRF